MERDCRKTQAKPVRLKVMMATLIFWKIRALALYMTPDKYHRTRSRGRGC
jgi:hypothetical protein